MNPYLFVMLLILGAVFLMALPDCGYVNIEDCNPRNWSC